MVRTRHTAVQEAGPRSDRRFQMRFGPEAVRAAAWIQPVLSDCGARDAASVVNLSAGGICLETSTLELRAGSVCKLLMALVSPCKRDFLATVQIKWVRKAPLCRGVMAGAEFLSSSSGWFGPEDETVQ